MLRMKRLQVRDVFLREIIGKVGRTIWNHIKGLKSFVRKSFYLPLLTFVPVTLSNNKITDGLRTPQTEKGAW